MNIEPPNKLYQPKKPRIALIITGFLRSFNYENIKRMILDHHDRIDIFIHLSADESTKDKYINKPISPSEISNLLKPKIMVYEPEIEGMSDLRRIWYKIYKMSNLITDYEEATQTKYDLMIRYRPDIYLSEPLNLTFNNTSEHIIIPRNGLIDRTKLKHETDPHICDILAYGPSNLMKKYCQMYMYLTNQTPNDQIHQNDQTKLNDQNKNDQNKNDQNNQISETALYYYLNEHQISYQEDDIQYKMILSQCNIIGISGDSGSGKTMLANLLMPLFGGEEKTLKFECDRYHKWERGDENWKKVTHLNPEANYLCKMQEDCFDLKIGNNVYQVDYDHKTGKFTNQQYIEPKDNVILCGLHTLICDKTNSAIDIKIFVDTDPKLQTFWKCRRDVTERGHSLQNVLDQIKKREPDYLMFIKPQKDSADVIINYYTDDQIDLTEINSNPNSNLNSNPDIKLRILISKEYSVGKLIEILTSENVNYSYSLPEMHLFNFSDEVFSSKTICEKVSHSTIKIKDGYSGLIQSIILYLAITQ